jgi:hypothetical protein
VGATVVCAFPPVGIDGKGTGGRVVMTWVAGGIALVLAMAVFPDGAELATAEACLGLAFEPPAMA